MTSDSQTVERSADRLTDQDIEALTWKEIGTAALFIARGRTFVFPVLFGLALVLILLQPDPWRVWLFVGAGSVVIGILIRDYFRLRDHLFTPRHVLYVLSVVLFFQSVLILVTGGSESPFFVVYIPMGLLPSLVIGRPRPFATFAVLPLTMVWFFTLGGLSGFLPRLTPDTWGSGATFGTNAIYTCARAAAFTIGILLGGIVGLFLRRALSRSLRRAIEAQQELVQSMRERPRTARPLG